MLAPLLALTLHAAEVWVATDGFDDASGLANPSCSSEALAAAVRAQRPGVSVRIEPSATGPVPPDHPLTARLTARGGQVTLDVRGRGKTITRPLPASDPCERNVATAALIVDGALDELRDLAAAPQVDSLAPPVPFVKQLHLSAALGTGVEQGVFTFVPAFAGEVALRYRYLELTLGGDFGLPSQGAFAILGPEPTGTGQFSTRASSGVVAFGVAPHLGPGRFLAELAFGLTFTAGSAGQVTPAPRSTTALFQTQTTTLTDPFGALRAGYALDLPWGLFLEARGEERLARSASFVADTGQSGGAEPTATTRRWAFQALGLLGYRFF